MLEEQKIQEELKQSIPLPSEHTPAPVAPTDTTDGQAKVADDYGLDEMTTYKLRDYFGDRTPDMEQLKYVYGSIAQEVGNDYFKVMDRIRELEAVVIVRNGEDRIFKLYQFIKLDTIRRQTEKEMSYLRNA